jgi:hypothetical protein
MITILATAQSATAAHIDGIRQCFWFAESHGGLSSVTFAGRSATQHQMLASPVTGMGSNRQVLVFAHQNGSGYTLKTEDPAAPISQQCSLLP